MPCPACNHPSPSVFFRMPRVPVFCNVLLNSRESALAAPAAEIALSYCSPSKGGCGLVFNSAFKPELMNYTGQYENALHFSAVFQQYAHDLARSLVQRHELRHKRIVELGCGDGQFLALLCKLGGNTGLGFDPAHDPARSREQVDASPGSLSIIREYYGPKHAHHPADFVACRHVLEHIDKPVDFLNNVRTTIGDRKEAIVFFEVPNALWTLEQLGIWDIIYEHVLYFTPPALSAAFRTAGFQPLATSSVYSGQFLTIESRLADAAKREPTPASADESVEQRRIESLVAAFGSRFKDKLDHWQRTLADLTRSGRGAVLWGAGSKGVTFLNVVNGKDGGGGGGPVKHIVDINPRKQGCFVAGSGQEIISPDRLRALNPAAVIIMNPAYRAEIASQLAALGVKADVLVA